MGKVTVTPHITASNKTYDGTTTATIATRLLTGVIGSDDVTLTGGTATFADAGVANGKTVTVTGLGLAGATAGNYQLSAITATTTANITPATVTPGILANNKVYDGNTTATLSSQSMTGVIGGDSVALGVSATSFSDKNVGNGKTVTATGLGLTGSAAGNYTLGATTATTTANITPMALTVTATSADKVYDGTTVATVTLSDNRVSGDTLTMAYTSASFADKNVGTAKTVGVSGMSIGGGDAGNYTANTTASTTASITAKGLKVTGVIANDKVYDGTTTATLSTGGAALVGVASGDLVALATGSASAVFADKNVGTGKTVTVSGIALSGGDSGNYTLTQPAATASISPATVTPSVTVGNKVYDGTAAATIASRSLSGVIGSDDVSLVGGTATFADANLGNGKTVTATGLSLSGSAAGNYRLSSTTATTTANITVGVLDHIDVTPAGAQTTVAGSTIQFAAQGRDAFNNAIGGLTYTWTVAAGTGSGVVSASGLFTGTVVGTATVTASSGSTSGTSAQITVGSAPLDHIEIVPGGPQSMLLGSSMGFTAQGRDSYGNLVTGLAVTWSVSSATGGGTIDASGYFTTTKAGTVAIVGSASGMSGASGTITIAAPPAPPVSLAVSTSRLPDGETQSPYSATLSATGGTAPYQWTVYSGALPAGMSLSAAGGLSGAPQVPNVYSFVARVTDASGQSAWKPFTLIVSSVQAHASVADLAVSSGDIWDNPRTIREGDVVEIGVNVFNQGDLAVNAGSQSIGVSFYDGDPSQGGRLIGAGNFSAIGVQERVSVSTGKVWNT